MLNNFSYCLKYIQFKYLLIQTLYILIYLGIKIWDIIIIAKFNFK